jgi:hypothetical protein
MRKEKESSFLHYDPLLSLLTQQQGKGNPCPFALILPPSFLVSLSGDSIFVSDIFLAYFFVREDWAPEEVRKEREVPVDLLVRERKRIPSPKTIKMADLTYRRNKRYHQFLRSFYFLRSGLFLFP